MKNQPPQRHLFVVGFARSGTSLLYSFLNLHPSIKLIFEADLMSHSLVASASFARRDWWQRLNFYSANCRRHGLVPQASWKNIYSAKEAATALYTKYGGDTALYIGEKSPRYYNCLPALARQFPEARFIVIWRNPRNVISSILSAGKKDYFFRNGSLPLRAIVGFEQMQTDVLALRGRGVPVFDLCYEDLVDDPEGHLKSICDFLEIPFTPGMLELNRADNSMLPPGEHHARVKSGNLTRFDRDGDALGNPVQLKIPRYIARWKDLFQDRLATRRYWRQAATEKPCAFELASDRFKYTLARFFSEQFTPFVYGFFPLKVLRLYRAWRSKKFTFISSSDGSVAQGAAEHPLKISVVTASYKQLPWLKLCVASIADQKGVNIEHIIQDADSGPDLENWVRQNTKADLHVECDSGMYDAINRGFARATGDIVCWLNSDEQYLEGALAKVASYFETHPEIDVLFGDALLISNTGALLSYRRTIPPDIRHIQAVHLNTLSCATFMRRSVLERGFKLDTQWRAIADAVFVADLIRGRIPIAVLNEPLAAFTITDSNLGQTSLAQAEVLRWRATTDSNNLFYRLYLIAAHRTSKLLHGAYWPRFVTTPLYTLTSPEKRIAREPHYVDFRWYRATVP